MLLIFVVSSDLGSSRNTSRIIGPIVRWFYPAATAKTIHVVQAIVRKTGHLTGYAVLAALLWVSLRNANGSQFALSKSAFFLVLAVCFIYACSDELHQHFVSSRQASFWDVLIDTTGAALALGLIFLWKRKPGPDQSNADLTPD